MKEDTGLPLTVLVDVAIEEFLARHRMGKVGSTSSEQIINHDNYEDDRQNNSE